MKPDITDFITLLEKEFDLNSPSGMTPQTVIRSVIEMSSINALIFIALIKTEYDVSITANDLMHAETVGHLFDAITSKQS